MSKAVEPEERQKIIDLLQEHGGNRCKVARIVGRSKGLISKIAKEENIESVNVQATKKAAEASKALRDISRMDIILDILETGRDLLDTQTIEPKDYKDVVTGLAIGIDKHRLETGEATSRTEQVDPERRQRMRESLDEVAAQRRRQAKPRLAG